MLRFIIIALLVVLTPSLALAWPQFATGPIFGHLDRLSDDTIALRLELGKGCGFVTGVYTTDDSHLTLVFSFGPWAGIPEFVAVGQYGYNWFEQWSVSCDAEAQTCTVVVTEIHTSSVGHDFIQLDGGHIGDPWPCDGPYIDGREVLHITVSADTVVDMPTAFIATDKYSMRFINRFSDAMTFPVTIGLDEGACCRDSGSCYTSTRHECEQSEFRTWLGGECDETDCAPYAIYGACCKENGICESQFATACASYVDDYTYFVEGAICEDLVCTPVGCCYWESIGMWPGWREHQCIAYGGEWFVLCDGYSPFKTTARMQ